MIEIIKVNISEVIEFKAEEDRMDLIEDVFYNLSWINQKKLIKKIAADFLEGEKEFDNRAEIVSALDLMNTLF